MAQQELSPRAKQTIAALNELALTELAKVAETASAILATKINDTVENSTPAKRAKASAKVAQGVAEAAPPATKSPAVGEIKTIDNHQAVVGQITVTGQQLDTLLSDGSFNKSRSDQHEYAAKLDYRMATRAENRAYVDSLLAKEEDNSINAAEANALKTYRGNYVRDDQGGLDVGGRRVRDFNHDWIDNDIPSFGALFVRASAESK